MHTAYWAHPNRNSNVAITRDARAREQGLSRPVATSLRLEKSKLLLDEIKTQITAALSPTLQAESR